MSGRRYTTAAVWVVGLGAAATVLQWTGGGALAAPSLTEPGQWASWLEARDPIVAAFSILRLVALGGLWYLAVVTLAGASLRMVGAASLVRVADRLTIGPVRRMLAGTMSLGLAASGVLAVAAPALRAPVAAAAQAVELPTTSTSTPATSTPATSTPATSKSAVSQATVTMHRLAPAETGQPPVVAPAPEIATATASPAGHWTVRPGECFWSIADSVLTEKWGRPASDAEIVPYWQRLIDANRHQLVQRDDPDLIVPGQAFVVPAP